MRCSALEHRGIDDIWALVQRFVTTTRDNGFFATQRARQSREWMRQLVQAMLMQRLSDSETVAGELPALERAVEAQRITPYNAARRVLALLDGCD